MLTLIQNFQYSIVSLLHALRRLTRDFDGVEKFKLGLLHVYVLVQGRPFAPLGDDGQDLLCGDTAHEEQHVDMPGKQETFPLRIRRKANGKKPLLTLFFAEAPPRS